MQKGSSGASTRDHGLAALIRSLELHDALGPEERRRLEEMPMRVVRFAHGQDIVREGRKTNECGLLLEGFAGRAHFLENGKRQMTAVHIPGDFIDLHGLLLKILDHSVVGLGQSSVAFVPHEDMRRLTENYPHLARVLWLSTLIDAAISRAWIVCLGRRSAEQHLGHLVCELYTRLHAVGLIDGDSFAFPVSQTEVGDMLGLSTVHVNRTLQNLRATGFLAWDNQVVTVRDFGALAKLAGFDPIYLNLFREPR